MRTVESLLAQENWNAERKALRALLLAHGLTECVKWNKLCYTYEQSTLAILYGFKKDCAVGFFKGSLLDDPDGVLVSPGEHSQAMRRLHFAGLEEIHAKEALINRTIAAAMAIEDQGLKVEFTEKHALDLPEELTAAFADDAPFENAFSSLTPGRQRGYILHFTGAKQAATRAARVLRCRDRILASKGLNDR